MKHYQPGDHRRELFDSLPLDVFVRLDTLESLAIPSPTVLLKVKPSMASVKLASTTLRELPFGRLEAISCAGLVIGYQIVSPKCTMNVRANFASLARRPSPSKDVEVYFVDKKLAVMGNPEALLAISSNIRWTSR